MTDAGDGASFTPQGGASNNQERALRPTIAVSGGGALNGSRRISRARNRLA